jgi:hypothetical protein
LSTVPGETNGQERTNNTRFCAIVTLQISGVVSPDKALAIGPSATPRHFAAALGIADWEVPASERLILHEGTEAALLAVRNAP